MLIVFFSLPPLDCVPVELKDPFYRDQYDQEHVKPPVVSLLLSAELYCRAGSLILRSDTAKPLLGHNAVIQALAQKGLYVTDQERLVTERDLCKTPIQMASDCVQHFTFIKLVKKGPSLFIIYHNAIQTLYKTLSWKLTGICFALVIIFIRFF